MIFLEDLVGRAIAAVVLLLALGALLGLQALGASETIAGVVAVVVLIVGALVVTFGRQRRSTSK